MACHLLELLCQYWEEGTDPRDMRDCNIITLYKNKGDESNYNNYKGILLLGIVEKAFVNVVLNTLLKITERVHYECNGKRSPSHSWKPQGPSTQSIETTCRKSLPTLVVFQVCSVLYNPFMRIWKASLNLMVLLRKLLTWRREAGLCVYPHHVWRFLSSQI